MKTLLVMTVGQTDVQFVEGSQKREFAKDSVGELHDYLRDHPQAWSLIDAPTAKGDSIQSFPDEHIRLCTPKFDAVLSWFKEQLPERILLLETRRSSEKGDPRFAGEVLKRRAEEKGIQNVTLSAYLDVADTRIEDRNVPIDAIIRRTVVEKIERAIANSMDGVIRVVVAAAGGMPEVKSLVRELARLHTPVKAQFQSIEANDAARDKQPDVAVERDRIDPVEVARLRRHALSLVEKGNLLGAWGAVSHLEDAPGQEWTQVVRWLSHFASSLPLPTGCDFAVLKNPHMAVRAALRVELALRTGDIPKAVHGTVAFFESALWDGLYERLERSSEPKKHRYFKVVNGNAPAGDKLLRAEGAKDNPSRPFQLKETVDGIAWYWVDDKDGGPGVRIAEHFLDRTALTNFAKVLAKKNDCDENFYSLRNDVAHNEPTPELMNEARTRMQNAGLWSNTDTFLSQPLVQNVLKELGEQCPEQLCNDLVSTVRERLLAIS
jgi:hypothetical protein